MKYINWLIGSLLTLAFLSCMDDKGSYDYTKLDEPVWKLREGSNTIWVELEKPRDFDPFGHAGLSPLVTI